MQRAYDSESMSLGKARKLNNIAILPLICGARCALILPHQPLAAASVENPWSRRLSKVPL